MATDDTRPYSFRPVFGAPYETDPYAIFNALCAKTSEILDLEDAITREKQKNAKLYDALEFIVRLVDSASKSGKPIKAKEFIYGLQNVALTALAKNSPDTQDETTRLVKTSD